jgi:RNA polymerase sigma-70 factor (ECF subfamily)
MSAAERAPSDSAVAARRRLNAELRAWPSRLQSSGADGNAAQAELRGFVLEVARREAARRSGWLRLSAPDLDNLARQAVEDAVAAIIAELGRFDRSQFTIWAAKFVLWQLSAQIGHRFWQTAAVPAGRAAWEQLPARLGLRPSECARYDGLFAALRQAANEDLTSKQRRVFMAVMLTDLPADALTTGLGSSRNSIYKALFEARRALRARLAVDWADLTIAPGARIDSPRWLDELLTAEAGDLGCDLAFEVIDRYAEAQVRGLGPQQRFPGVAAHLRGCRPCHQDYDGLLAVARLPGGSSRVGRP